MKIDHGSSVTIAGVDKPISKLVLGTAFYAMDEKERWFGMLDAFHDAGGRVIDTARQYGEGEELIGMWMESRQVRDQMVVITKGGHGEDQLLPEENLAAVIAEELTTSLQMLRIAQVDLYLLHRDNPAVPVSQVIDCLNHEISRGRIASFGVSNWEYERAQEANEYARAHDMRGLSVVSNNLSLAAPAAPFYPGLVSCDERGERWHQENGTPLVSWSSGARGFFTGAYSPDMRSGQLGRDQFTERMIQVYCSPRNFERLDRALQLGEKLGGLSAIQISLAWLLNKPFPVLPVIGVRTQEELSSSLRALSIRLSEDEVEWLAPASSG